MSQHEHFARSFTAVASEDCRILILGSLPGRRSLADAQYYAQPRNAFWPIIGELLGIHPDLDYEARLEGLLARKIALWDVIAAGVRPGSLDSSIERSTIVVNDFSAFFEIHTGICRILFNGKTAAGLYGRLVRPKLPPAAAAIDSIALPSTSPAYAAMSYQRKLAAWRQALITDGCRSRARE